MICTYVSRGDQYNNYDVTSARNIFQSSGHSKMVSNTSQTYPKYLISIGIIIWNEKKDFRTLSRGDHNHWCVGKENNRPKSTLCFQHWCSTCYIKDRFLICCYLSVIDISNQVIKIVNYISQSSAPPPTSEVQGWLRSDPPPPFAPISLLPAPLHPTSSRYSNIAFSLTIINRKHFSVWFLN